ncbi:MAG: hypothetical protein FJ294_00350 [Planctomycetes bacterium]|nr:hypothetical protein [Planctomycetota bacterium]
MHLTHVWRTSRSFRVAVPVLALGSVTLLSASLATTLPNEVRLPGTQELEVSAFDPSSNCEMCHGQYDPEVSPYETWSGSMMAHAGRDPMFWAALPIAEQDFGGSGDLCIRCHAPLGWYDGRSQPTDGSALVGDDFDGVSCEFCHKLTNPDDSEHLGEHYPPFKANDGGSPPVAYLGSGEAVVSSGFERLGPYNNPAAYHPWAQSQFHRKSDLCGTCHDVSNPVTGDLAPGNGAYTPLPTGMFNGTLGGPLQQKAALQNAPHKWGVVERTFSEHIASAFETMRVSDFDTLPIDLRKGSIARAYRLAKQSTPTGDYEDGAARNFTCQTCHMSPVEGYGCSLFSTPQRTDIPKHDLTGGNYWAPDAILYLDALGRLYGGNGLTTYQISSMQAGKQRAVSNLKNSAAMTVNGNTLRVTNLTGHKLISGYAEGRRMWLNVKWYGANGALVREDGEYGPLPVTVNGTPYTVETILDINDPDTKVYEANMGVSQAWAAKLLTMGYSASLPLKYDRVSGAPASTLGAAAAGAPGSAVPSFHFVLNDATLVDNRIPPYKMSYDEAVARNAQPIPSTQFGSPGAGGFYNHWDDITLNPPSGAVRADIALMYQPTSWEYVQFLVLANNGSITAHAGRGNDLFEAWRNTGMAAPVVMTEAKWGTDAPVTYCTAKTNSQGCLPQIGYTGVPSASSGSGFHITASNVLNRRQGMLRATLAGPSAAPFRGGTNCVLAPAARLAKQESGGTALPALDCSGGFVVDFNEYIASGANPALVAGATVWVQWWSRDPGFPAPNNFGFTNGLRFTIGQ